MGGVETNVMKRGRRVGVKIRTDNLTLAKKGPAEGRSKRKSSFG